MKKTHLVQKKRLTEKKISKYECIICDFKSSNKTDYKRHLKTKKHNDLYMEISLYVLGFKPPLVIKLKFNYLPD